MSSAFTPTGFLVSYLIERIPAFWIWKGFFFWKNIRPSSYTTIANIWFKSKNQMQCTYFWGLMCIYLLWMFKEVQPDLPGGFPHFLVDQIIVLHPKKIWQASHLMNQFRRLNLISQWSISERCILGHVHSLAGFCLSVYLFSF